MSYPDSHGLFFDLYADQMVQYAICHTLLEVYI